ncbi:hypothetical protein KSW81_008416 [Nannochloris sp. 'desiccata']|nr:hypothetical protein KSW81_008416 [Chlorella desiccata (nom. nud.)]
MALAVRHEGAGDLVRLAERHTLPHEPVGDVCRQREALGGESGHALSVEAQGRHHAGEGRQQHFERLDGVEHGLFVFLQVAVVREGQSLECRQQAREVANESPRLAARELGDVGVLLLRHDRRARREAVVQGHVAELAGVPEDDLFCQPRQVNAELRRDVGELGDEVACGRRVDRVLGRAAESELGRDEGRIEAQARASQSPSAVGRAVASRRPVAQALEVAHERPRVGEQVVGQQHRLCVLQVGAAGHDGIGMRVGLRREGLNERAHLARDHGPVVAQVEPHEGGDLVVAAASRAQATAELGAHRLDQRRLEGTMHVFIVGPGLQAAVCPAGFDSQEPLEHPHQFVVGEVARRSEGASVGPRASDVVAAELPVKVRRAAEPLQFRRGAVAEAPAPQRALVRSTAHCAPPDCAKSHTRSAFCACRTVLGLVPDDRLRAVDDVSGDLVAAVGGQAVQEERVGLRVRHHGRVDAVGAEGRDAMRLLVFFAHRDPGIGDDDVGPRDGRDRVGRDRDRAARLGRAALGIGDHRGTRRERRGGSDAHVHARRGPGKQVRLRHVARSVAEERDREPLEITAMLADSQQVGEQLARVEVVTQSVDDGHGRTGRHFFEPRLCIGAPHDRGHHALEHARGVARRLFAAELAAGGRDDERHPRRGRRRARSGGQRVRSWRGGLRSSGGQCCGEESEKAVDLSIADDERRREADALVVRRVDDEAAVQRLGDDSRRDGGGEPHAEQQAATSHLGDEGRTESQDALPQLVAASSRVAHEVGPFDLSEHSIGDSGRKRIAPEGRAVLAEREEVARSAPGDERADRHSPADALGENDRVWQVVGVCQVVLEGKPVARAARAGLDLVDDEQGAVPARQPTRLEQKLGRQRHDAGFALDGLEHDGRDIVTEGRLERGEVGRQVLDARQPRLEGLAQGRLAGQREGAHGAAVKPSLEGEDARPARATSELDRRLDGLSTRVGRVHPTGPRRTRQGKRLDERCCLDGRLCVVSRDGLGVSQLAHGASTRVGAVLVHVVVREVIGVDLGLGFTGVQLDEHANAAAAQVDLGARAIGRPGVAQPHLVERDVDRRHREPVEVGANSGCSARQQRHRVVGRHAAVGVDAVERLGAHLAQCGVELGRGEVGVGGEHHEHGRETGREHPGALRHAADRPAV